LKVWVLGSSGVVHCRLGAGMGSPRILSMVVDKGGGWDLFPSCRKSLIGCGNSRADFRLGSSGLGPAFLSVSRAHADTRLRISSSGVGGAGTSFGNGSLCSSVIISSLIDLMTMRCDPRRQSLDEFSVLTSVMIASTSANWSSVIESRVT
jgi:hypothetical protein